MGKEALPGARERSIGDGHCPAAAAGSGHSWVTCCSTARQPKPSAAGRGGRWASLHPKHMGNDGNEKPGEVLGLTCSKCSVSSSHVSSAAESARCWERLGTSTEMQTRLVPRPEQRPRGLGAAGVQPGAPTAASKGHCVHMEHTGLMPAGWEMPSRQQCPQHPLVPWPRWGSSLPSSLLGAKSCPTPGQRLAAPPHRRLRSPC